MLGQGVLVQAGEQPYAGRDAQDPVAREQEARGLVEGTEMPTLMPRRRDQAKPAPTGDEDVAVRERPELAVGGRIVPRNPEPSSRRTLEPVSPEELEVDRVTV